MKPGCITITALSVLCLLAGSAAWAGAPNHGDPEAGSVIYHQTCVACHGEDGKGQIPGAPDFTEAGGVLSQPDKVLADRIVHGFQSKGSPMAMPAGGGNPDLSPADVANVIAYLHKAYGH